MKKNKIIFLAGTACSLLLLLFLYYNFSYKNSRDEYLKNGGFTRTKLSSRLSSPETHNLINGQYTVVGIVDGKIMIREFLKENLIMLQANNAKDTINLPNIIHQKDVFSISLNPFDKNVVDIQCNNDNKIFEFDIKKRSVIHTYDFGHYFYKAIRASKNSFYALIQSDKSKAGLVLVNFDQNGRPTNTSKSNLLTIDAMSEDGTLIKSNAKLIYANYYNNKFSIVDSSLKKISAYKTIDTVTVLPKTVNIKNNTITKFVNQPRPVNQLVRVSDKFLFVNSYVKADNDLHSDAENSETIDVYDINNRYKYKGTIYIKRQENNRVQDFLVQGNKLILQYPNKTFSYEFSI